MEIVLDYAPMPKQELFHYSKARFRLYIGGIGSGKTLAGSHEAIKLAIKYPKTTGVIVAPTYPMLRDATQETFFSALPRALIKNFNKSENILELINGSKIMFRSAEFPDRLRGPNLDWFWIDEGSEVSRMTWKILIGRIRKGIIDVGFVTCTPKGRNWVYEEFAKIVRDNYFMVQSSSKENIHLTEDFIVSLMENYSGAFAKQEIGGEFVAFEGLVYPGFTSNHVLKWEDFDKIRFKDWCIGIDFGFVNPSVALLIGFDDDDRAYVVREIYQRRLIDEDFIKMIKGWHPEFSFHRLPGLIADPSEAGMIEKMRRLDLNVMKAKNSVLPGINEVSKRLIPKADKMARLYVFDCCPQTINEFGMYRYPEDKEGKNTADVPVKDFDHAMDALRYVVYTREKGKGYTPTIA